MYPLATSPRNQFPFGPACQPFGRFCMTMPQRIFTCVIRSHLLGASRFSANRLSPSLPCTPTLDNQSHAVGRCCLSTTLRVGVTPTWIFSCQRAKLLLALCRSSPILAYSFERTGRTTACSGQVGTRRDLQAFFWLWFFSTSQAAPSPPTCR